MSRTLIHKEVDNLPHPIGEVWSIISAFGAIKTWIPTLDSCSADGIGIGAIRTATTGGNSVREQLEILDTTTHSVSYQLLEPTGLPMKKGYGTLWLRENGDGVTEITWLSDAEEVSEEGKKTIQAVFGPFMRKAIGGLKAVLARPAEPIL